MLAGLFHYRARILSVYDGDTVTAEVDLGFKVHFTEKVRLYGIDAPELRGDERKAGLKSRDRLRALVLGKEIILKSIKDRKGKYGRYLGILYVENKGIYVNVNDLLVNEGYAIKKEY